MTRFLVTGGGGFIGSTIVRFLLEECGRSDVEIVVFDVEPLNDPFSPNTSASVNPAVRFVRGDVRDAEGLLHACEGVACVFHTASLIAVSGDHATAEAVNVEGTANALAACRAKGVSWFIYTSSSCVTFNGQPQRWTNESESYAPRYYCPYVDTKRRAEGLVLAADGDSLATCVIRPCCHVWGPGDRRFLKFLPMLLKVRVATRARLEATYVDHAAVAHVLAYQALRRETEGVAAKESHAEPVHGTVFLVGDEDPEPVSERHSRLLTQLGLRPPTRSLPVWFLLAVAWILTLGAWILRPFLGRHRSLAVTPFEVRSATTDTFHSIARARNVLGYTRLVEAKEAERRTVEYYRKLQADGSLSS